MNRIGVLRMRRPISRLRCGIIPGSSMEGIFTHFATADVPGDWDFEHQKERFARYWRA